MGVDFDRAIKKAIKEAKRKNIKYIYDEELRSIQFTHKEGYTYGYAEW